MKDFLSLRRRRLTTEPDLTSYPTSNVGSDHYQPTEETTEMTIETVTNEATRQHNNFVQKYGHITPFYVRVSSILGILLGREVQPHEIAMFELAHAQARVSLNPSDPDAFNEMIVATAAAKIYSAKKSSSFEDKMLADVEANLIDSMNGN
jgi:hypothetical protein